MIQHSFRQLETYITHRCNLSCSHCSVFCNYHYEYPDIEFAVWYDGIKNWSHRLKPQLFRILGGEPFLRSDLDKFIIGMAECFPDSTRDIATNGLFLRKNKHLFPLLIETKTRLTISCHVLHTEKQQEIFDAALIYAYMWQKKGLNLQISRNKNNWGVFYQGEGNAIIPFADNKPFDSLKSCTICKHCKVIHQNALWRCPVLMHIPMIADRLENRNLWEPYLAYAPMALDTTDEVLNAFLRNDVDDSFCGMCPSTILETSQSRDEGVLSEDPYGELQNELYITKKLLDEERIKSSNMKRIES